ncbi:alpha/beta hydrolase [Methylocaldum sp.]|uniref:alpha/beta fold hydrolase n=1 Tax=Methylocaldum sp. TaxID=1969727 RepID=UPI002D5F5D7D|nr:alpha/beta hydrolase [Methylocaldum sp.]HYE37254.1 alpha/beta hydrolase [Methylocaldum sp.]
MVDVAGHRARVLEAGRGGPAVVILASPLIHADVYRPTIAALARRTHVLVADLPGCGAASRVERPLEMHELADLVPPLLNGMGLDSALLVGHSNSGAIAVHAAVRHPERVDRLVLADSIGAHPSVSLVPILAGRAWDAVIEWRLTLTGLPAIARNVLYHPRSFCAQVTRCAGDGLLVVAAHVRCPTLLAWGARDHTMPVAAAHRFQAAIPDAQLVVSPTGSHDWIIEEPEAFACAVVPGVASPDGALD